MDVPAPGQVRETHSGVVVLVGDRAYKSKKPVDLGFLDFRDRASRWAACRRELELNRRLAPDVYLGLARFIGSDGDACDDGASGRDGSAAGEPVLVMRRMPDDRRLAVLARAGVPLDDEIRDIARLLAGFHAAAERGPESRAAAGADALRRRWLDNIAAVGLLPSSLIGSDVRREVADLALDWIDGRQELLAERAARRLAVDGHGDLMADDIFCLPDGPRVLDCLEFDDTLRRVDVVDDVAFLAMDLEHLGRADLAVRLFDDYAEFSGVAAVPALQHHYVAYRAFVRAKVSGIRALQGAHDAGPLVAQYAAQALQHLRAGRPQLVLVGGAPGSGKSTVAGALADELGAVLLATDRLRPSGSDRYTTGSREAAYRELLRRAARALRRGESVVADATWTDAALRAEAAQLAAATRSGVLALECRAPLEVAARRAEQRRATGLDPSEAGGDIARVLAAARSPWPGAVGIDTSGDPDDALVAARAAVRAVRCGPSTIEPPPGANPAPGV